MEERRGEGMASSSRKFQGALVASLVDEPNETRGHILATRERGKLDENNEKTEIQQSFRLNHTFIYMNVSFILCFNEIIMIKG